MIILSILCLMAVPVQNIHNGDYYLFLTTFFFSATSKAELRFYLNSNSLCLMNFYDSAIYNLFIDPMVVLV